MKKAVLISLLICCLLLLTVVPNLSYAADAVSFTDINGHWAKAAITRLTTAGYLKGYPDKTFRPNATISRAEFITVLLSCAGFNPQTTGSTKSFFADTANHWALADINEAVNRGVLVVKEYPGGLKPDGPIYRSESAAMMVRALGKSPDNNVSNFKDSANVVKSMYAGYIKTANNEGLISGYPSGEIKPFGTVTRAEACVMLANFLDKNSQATTPETTTSTTGTTTDTTNKSSNTLDSLTYDNHRYNSDFVNVYIGGSFSNYYLSDMVLVDPTTVKIAGVTYDLNTKDIVVKLSEKFYRVNGVVYTGSAPSLNLAETDSVELNGLSLSDITAIFVGSESLNLSEINSIKFLINDSFYSLADISIDSTGKVSVGNTASATDQIIIKVDDNYYIISDIQHVNKKFIFFCTDNNTSMVKINNSYYDASEVQILKDNLPYNLDSIVVVKQNVIRIGGKQYNINSTSSCYCRFNNKIYEIDKIDYNDTLNMITMNISEVTGSVGTNQPQKYVFYVNGSIYQDGVTSAVTIYANGDWRTFSNITITDPSHFYYNGSTNDLIDAKIKINSDEFLVTDSSWHGQSLEMDLYLQKS